MTIGEIFLSKFAQKAGFGYGKTGNALKKRDLPKKNLGIEVENLEIAPKLWD